MKIFIVLKHAFLPPVADLPMTIRSCFYPILGDRIFGFMGDCIDILSVVATMFGVCTSLGLGVLQLNAGLYRLNNDIPISTTTQIITIWCITAVATMSVVSGLKIGIRRLSEFCFALGMVIMLMVFFANDTWYFLNLYVQSIGYYLQNALALGFHTDAFEQLGNSQDEIVNPNWMNSWTIFYWGWWTSWSPFVGMFIARISKGRTVGEFIQFTITIPILYTFMWFTIFGGAGLKMERDALMANITCDSVLGGTNATDSRNGLYRLSCRNINDQWFDIMYSHGDMGGFLSVVSLASIILYFVTSSDSGSLVIDILSANGHDDPPLLQRIFWALTEGACATALLVAGGEKALTALQAVSVAAGLPFSFLLCLMSVSLWRALKSETGKLDISPQAPRFHVGLLDMFDDFQTSIKFFLAFVVPWFYLGDVVGKNEKIHRAIPMVILALLFNTAILLAILELVASNLGYLGLTLYFGFVAYCASVRSDMRVKDKINGNLVEDFFAALLMYPCVVVQLYEHANAGARIESDSAAKEVNQLESHFVAGNAKGEENPTFATESERY